MCGIAGGLSFNGALALTHTELHNISKLLKFRGPECFRTSSYNTENASVSFLHTRLSIIDLTENGNQPMTSITGNSSIVFNGEIYNYKSLKKELILKGFEFRTESDTEVILNAFECWGLEETLKKLDGMFAFGIYDYKNERLFLARDKFGKKPLYYFETNSQIYFSSDIRAFLQVKSFKPEVDLYSLGYFFSENSTPLEHTIWKNVKKLKPASFLIYSKAGIDDYKTYWTLRYTEDCMLGVDTIVDTTDQLLENAVKRRLVSDVRVSALLSGGLDSSLVVAKMAIMSSDKIKTYSVGFNEQEYSELKYARQIATLYNTDHSEYIVNSFEIRNIENLIMEFGEPFADPSMIPLYLISSKVSENEKVVLGGDGGDELFGGYENYYLAFKYDQVKRFAWLYPLVNRINQKYSSYRINLLNSLLSKGQLPPSQFLNRNFSFSKEELMQLLNSPIFFESVDNEHVGIWNAYTPKSKNEVINVMSASYLTRLVNDYLVKIDRASMFCSLEMRSPFLDSDLASFAATLKPEQLFKNGEPKFILKRLAKKYLPHELIYRKKMGFGVPLAAWFKDDLFNYVAEVILGGKQNLVHLNYNFIEKILNEHKVQLEDHSNKIWALFVFHIWAQNIISRD